MTDKSVLKSILNPKRDPCWVTEQAENNSGDNKVISVNAVKKRRIIAFVIRDLIWKLGRWKSSRTLNEFLDENKPDVIYLPVYSSPHICNVQQYIIDQLKVPVVAHISDDEYNIPPKLPLLVRMYRKYAQKKVVKIISSCEYLEVFAQNMADEYSRIFNIPCYLIGKGVTQQEMDSIPLHKPQNNGTLKIIYTGNISTERYRVLYMLGQTIDRGYKGRATIDIYTQTIFSDQMQAGFDSIDAISLKGAVSSDEVRQIQKEADILLHIEGFSDTSIFETKMSFSTKIIDYMLTGIPILAIGPQEVNSIEVLRNNDLATVITKAEDTPKILDDLFANKINLRKKNDNIIKYLKNNRDIHTIQNGIYTRLLRTLNK